MTAPCVLYHALGGGLGHAVRALAVARQLSRRVGGRHVVLVNTPLAPAVQAFVAAEPGLEMLSLGGLGADEVAAFVQEQVKRLRPDLFVVDTFPRGVGGELVELLEGWSACPRVLIARPLRREYADRFRLTAFVRRHYDLVLTPGEPGRFADLPMAVDLPPFLIRDWEELPAREQALQRLQASEPVVLIAGNGSVAECRGWQEEARRLAQEWPGELPPLRLALPPGVDEASQRCVWTFPLIDCLPGVRVVVGNAGYHLVHEARAVGVAGLFRARARQYDEQGRRVREEERCDGELLNAIRRRLSEEAPLSQQEANGAALAAERLLGLAGSIAWRRLPGAG